VGGYLDEILKQCFPLLSKQKKQKVAAAVICFPDLSYSPLLSPLRDDTFLFIILPDSKNPSFPVLLHQLLRG